MRVSAILLLGGCAALVLAVIAVQKTPAQRERQRRQENRERYGFKNVVRGRVVDARGRPIAGVRVAARFRMHQTGMVGEGDAETDGDGRYTIPALGVNDFVVGVDVRDTPYLVPAPQRADLTRAIALVRDFTLTEGPRITVRVRDAETGEPIPGIDVRNAENGSGGPAMGRTDARGEYSWRANSRSQRIELGNVVDNAAREAYGAAPGYAFFREFELKDSRPFVWETKAYRRPFEPKDVAFRGVVVDESNRPLAGARVRLVQYVPNGPQTTTDAQGRFSVKGRRILNFGEDHSDDIVLFVDAGGRSATFRPTPEQTWGEMRVVARHGALAEARGRVVDERGKPAMGVPISYSEYFVGGMSGGGRAEPTDEDGRFRVPALRPGGRYSLTLGSWGGWGVTHVPANWPRGPELVFRAGERRDLGTLRVPRAPAVVAGRVVKWFGGEPETRSTLVTLKGAHTDLTTVPDASGAFRFAGVVEEPLTIRVFAAESGGGGTDDDNPNRLLSLPVRAGDRGLRLRIDWRPPRR